jgi:hypothetical protein
VTTPDLTPTVQDVADLLPRRTIDGSGRAVGTFTSATVPNDEQVARVCGRYAREVLAAVAGTADLPPALQPRATDVAALGAAAHIETTFFPEDADSIAKVLWARYDAALKQLLVEYEQATGADAPGDDGDTSGAATDGQQLPSFAFPSVTDDLSRLLAGYGARPVPLDWPLWP